jgi:hypothetical protein
MIHLRRVMGATPIVMMGSRVIWIQLIMLMMNRLTPILVKVSLKVTQKDKSCFSVRQQM